jgi:hypothetical protein
MMAGINRFDIFHSPKVVTTVKRLACSLGRGGAAKSSSNNRRIEISFEDSSPVSGTDVLPRAHTLVVCA